EAARLLIAHGYDRVRNLSGGIEAYMAEKVRVSSTL
ncbi:MAG: hypothetical protein QOJ65_1911, partial [Fimbriimonadaceae bacterium]|nr:hypothetical protein [Fimbriimonadaceae bacterium]